MKIRIINLLSIILLIILTGCTSEAKIQPQTVTFVNIGVFPAAYDVYVFTQDQYIHYDLTDYWLNTTDGFDYFSDPLPSEDSYHSEERSLDKSEWDSIVNTLADNHFSTYPEDISFENITDVGWSFIEVQTKDYRYFSGGWGAGYGTGKTQKGYSQICATLHEIIIK